MNLLATQIVASALRYLFKSTFHSLHENSPPLQLLSFYLSQFVEEEWWSRIYQFSWIRNVPLVKLNLDSFIQWSIPFSFSKSAKHLPLLFFYSISYSWQHPYRTSAVKIIARMKLLSFYLISCLYTPSYFYCRHRGPRWETSHWIPCPGSTELTAISRNKIIIIITPILQPTSVLMWFIIKSPLGIHRLDELL